MRRSRGLYPGLATCCALTFVACCTFLWLVAEGAARASASSLGSAGTTVRIVATVDHPRRDFVGTQRFMDAVRHFTTDTRTSIAFSASTEPTVITLFDPSNHFTLLADDTNAELSSRSDQRIAAVAATVPLKNRSRLLGKEVSIVGEFLPLKSFDATYPAAAFSMAASPPGSGLYLIAGEYSPQKTVEFFDDNGLEVVNITIQKPPTVASTLSGIYGGVVAGLATVLLTTTILLTQMSTTLRRPYLLIIASLGASRFQLWKILVRILAPQFLIGLLCGTTLVLLMFLMASPLMLTGTAPAVEILLSSLVICCASWLPIITSICILELRRCQHVVPC